MNNSEIIEIYLNSKTADISSELTSDVIFYISSITIDKTEIAYISIKNCVYSHTHGIM